MTSPTTVPALATVTPNKGMAGAGNVEAGNQFTTMNNISAFRVSYSKDGSIAKSKIANPVISLDYALADAHKYTRGNKTVTILYCDAGEYCAENKGKWFLHGIVK